MSLGTPCLHMRALCWLWATLASTSAYQGNFPTKSVNIAAADTVAFYKVLETSTTGVEDAHAVHGASTSDGGWVVVGKGLEADGSSVTEAFAVKFTSAGSVQWTYKSGISGADAFNAIIQLPDGGDLIAVGYRQVGGVNCRSLVKRALATGAASWAATSLGDSTGAHGGYETVAMSSDGSSLYAGGFKGKPDTEEYSFKSYGNVAGGSALIDAFPVSVLATAPTSASVSWTWSLGSRGTVKSVHAFSGGDLAALTFTDGGSQAEVFRITSSGATSWGPTDIEVQHGEGTELVISADGWVTEDRRRGKDLPLCRLSLRTCTCTRVPALKPPPPSILCCAGRRSMSQGTVRRPQPSRQQPPPSSPCLL